MKKGKGKSKSKEPSPAPAKSKEASPAPARSASKEASPAPAKVEKSKKKKKQRKGKHVYIEDDSDNEKILSSDEEKGKKGHGDDADSDQDLPRGPARIPGVPASMLVAPKPKPKEGEEGEEDRETADDEETRMLREKEEMKRVDRMERLREERLKRMQAFMQSSGIKEDEEKEGDDDEEEEEEEEEKPGDFYKSYHEEEQKQKPEGSVQSEGQGGELYDPEKADEYEEQEQEGEEEKKPAPVPSYIGKLPRKKEKKTKVEGVGSLMAKLRESPPKSPPPRRSPSPPRSRFGRRANPDRPNKREVDKQQAEMETWADRFYQNKKVQNVVKSSNLMSKVQKKIKLKGFNLGDGAKDKEGEDSGATSSTGEAKKEPTNEELPKVGLGLLVEILCDF